MRNIGGSLLPSNSPAILQPIPTSVGVLRLVVDAAEDTHKLFLNDELLAEHPNGFSCNELAKCIATRNESKALMQGSHIRACGGQCDLNRIADIELEMRRWVLEPKHT